MTRRPFVSLVVAVTIIAIAGFVRTPSFVGEGARGDLAREERAGEGEALKSSRSSRNRPRSASRHCGRREPPVVSDSERGSSRHHPPAGPASSS
jgi:hypothetical protein